MSEEESFKQTMRRLLTEELASNPQALKTLVQKTMTKALDSDPAALKQLGSWLVEEPRERPDEPDTGELIRALARIRRAREPKPVPAQKPERRKRD